MAGRSPLLCPAGATLARLNRHFTTCAAIATAGCAMVGSANNVEAAIVYSGTENLATGTTRLASIPSFLSLNVQTNTFSNSTVVSGSNNLIFDQNQLVDGEGNISILGPGGGAIPTSIYDSFVVNDPWGDITKLNAGMIVGASSTWVKYSGILAGSDSYNGVYGNWNGGVTDKFVGVSFTLPSGTTQYGWIRLNVTSDYVLTIVDWAYESTPGASIVTGDTGTPVPEPSSAAALGTLALGAIGVRSRRRKTV